MNKKIYIITLIVILIDQLIKLLVNYNDINLIVIPNFLTLINVHNKGAAFSMLSGHNTLIIFFSIILFIVLISMYKKEFKNNDNKSYQIVFGILFGGILGNLIDRVFKGEVIDYVSLQFGNYYYPVFNIADIAITIGVLLLIYIIIKEKDKK